MTARPFTEAPAEQLSQEPQSPFTRRSRFASGSREWRDYPLDVEELLRAELGLRHVRRQGNEVTACCPFHDDRNPSFSVSLAKPGYPCQCWSCSWRGNAITLVREALSCSSAEALRVLNKYGATFSLVPKQRSKSRNNWRGAGRKPDPYARAILQRRCINRKLRDAPQRRSELVKALEQEEGLKKSSAYRLINSLLEQRVLLENKKTRLVTFFDPSLYLSFRNSNRKRNGNFEIQSESGDVSVTSDFSVTWNEQGYPVVAAKRPCSYCGEPVEGRRSKRYCSAKCRQRAFQVKQVRAMPEWDYRMTALENVSRIFSDDLNAWEEGKQRDEGAFQGRKREWSEIRSREWSRWLSGEISTAEYCKRVPWKPSVTKREVISGHG